jgi:hypothetical protein
VFWQTVGALYRLETERTETPAEHELAEWLATAVRADLNYLALLERLAPAPEERRAFLAQFFEGREPGETHRRPSALASGGLVRIFVTTNFDPLLWPEGRTLLGIATRPARGSSGSSVGSDSPRLLPPW